MKKTYFLDPEILLNAPHALLSFEDNDVILPLCVLEILSKHKDSAGEQGINAKEALNLLESIQNGSSRSFTHGASLGEGKGILRVISDERNVSGVYKDRLKDLNIPTTASRYTEYDDQLIRLCCTMDYKTPCIIVSNKAELRIRAQMCGIEAQAFQADRVKNNHTGRAVIWIADDVLEMMFRDNYSAYRDGYTYDGDSKKTYQPQENEFLEVHSEVDPKKTALCVYKTVFNRGILLRISNDHTWIRAKNAGQSFAQYALQDNNIPLVIIKGPAGTGKTLLALAEGLHKLEQEEYQKMLICRPNAQFDDDIGFLPGTEREKIDPLMRPIVDNLEYLVSGKKNKAAGLAGISDPCMDERDICAGILQSKKVSIEALNYIRGRSISKTWIIVDEAQNLTQKQAKGIVTRAGFDSKIILLGDPEQIDHPHLDRDRNGLVYAAEAMANSAMCAQVTMLQEECVRSDLAKEAAGRM